MKITHLLISIAIVSIFGCTRTKEQINHFSSLNDTLFLKTEIEKGYGLFGEGADPLTFFKPDEDLCGLEFKLPHGINSIEIASLALDCKPMIYQNLKNGDTALFLSAVKKFKIDTTSILKQDFKQNYISILRGSINDSTIIIVDQNNNKDFSDDTIRAIEPFQLNSLESLIRFNYEIFNGSEIVPAYSWLNIGQFESYGDILFCCISEHVNSTFSIDKKSFTISVTDGQRYCSFLQPQIAIIEENGTKKDSLLNSEIFEKEEYLKLGINYYKFENISNDGSFVTLVKEKDVSNKIGTQVGFIAPNFQSTTLEDKMISLRDYKGKYLLLANITGCWSEPMSYEYYKELTEKYASKLDIIGIDNSTNFLKQNIKDLNLSGTFVIAENNPLIQKNYREDFCSRICFLIDTQGRIIDKFEINDWKVSLAKIFD